MGQRGIIYRNRLEGYVKHLYFNERKTLKEIAQSIQKKKKISISSEAVRGFINRTKTHIKTQ
jgi:hypothetical protein